MTRAAALEGFEEFIGEAVQATYREFNVVAALQGANTPGSNVVDRLLKQSEALDRRVVRPELRAFQSDVIDQFEILLSYVDSGEPIGAYREDLLAADRYAKSLRESVSGERRERLEDLLVERQQRLGDAIEPIVASPDDSFWRALVESFDREAAQHLIETHFEFTGPLQTHPDAFVLQTRIDPGDILSGPASLLGSAMPSLTVEYTDEALRAMRAAEAEVIRETQAEVEDRFDALER
ncbi:MAG: hypothetical protein ABEH66_01010 [Halobacteriales archaeon]